MTPRSFLAFLPLLGVLAIATYALPERPDDEAGYVSLAHRLTEGSYTTGDDEALLDDRPSYPDLWFGPGLPLVLAPLVALDAPLDVLRATGPLFLFGAILLFYVLVGRRASNRTALVAAYALGLYVPFYTLLPNVHSEPLAILLLVGGLLATAVQLERGDRTSLLVAGAAFAGLALTRVAFGWVLTAALVATAVWWASSRSPDAARTTRIFAVAVICCTPWLAYTWSQTGRPLVWGNSGSLSLYWMSSPYDGDYGDWHQADKVFSDPNLAAHRPFFETLRDLPLAEQNRRLEREALSNIAGDPLKYALNVAANGSRLLFNSPYSFERQSPKALVYALPNSLVFGAVVLALVLLLPRRGTLPREAVPFLMLGTATVGLHLLVASYPRMLMPVVPIVIWFLVRALLAVGLVDDQPARRASAV